MAGLLGALRVLHPGRSLRARLGFIFGGLSLALAVLLALLLGHTSRIHSERETGEALATLASPRTDTLDRWLSERCEDVLVSAELQAVRDEDVPLDERRRLLETFRQAYPGYLWIGLIDEDKQTIKLASGGILEGQPAPKPPPGLRTPGKPYLGDVRTSYRWSAATGHKTPLRVMDLAFPIPDDPAHTHQTLWVFLDWQWAEEIRQSMRAQLPN
jgi:hypothetical protein